MKNLRQFCAASMLTLMLTLTVFAGEIDIGYMPQPKTITTKGGIETPRATGEIDTPLIAEAALNVLHSMLSLF